MWILIDDENQAINLDKFKKLNIYNVQIKSSKKLIGYAIAAEGEKEYERLFFHYSDEYLECHTKLKNIIYCNALANSESYQDVMSFLIWSKEINQNLEFEERCEKATELYLQLEYVEDNVSNK